MSHTIDYEYSFIFIYDLKNLVKCIAEKMNKFSSKLFNIHLFIFYMFFFYRELGLIRKHSNAENGHNFGVTGILSFI